ncbi:MAG: CapA family protein [Bacteroidota bacterium]
MKYKIHLVSFLMASAIALFVFGGFSHVEPKHVHAVPKKNGLPDTTFTLLFGGDMMGHQPLINAACNDSLNNYDYLPWFQFMAPYINQCSWACANLEVTLAGEPYSGYPQFSSPDEYALSLKNAGFDFLVNANNHSQDRGSRGLERTIKVLDSIGIAHAGTYVDTISFHKDYPAIINIADCKIAILNYTYGTNGLVVKNPNMVNLIDSATMIKAIDKAKSLGAQFVIPVMHWGIEYEIKENAEQQHIAEILANGGADAIIGMHPHVVEPIKYIPVKSRKSNVDSIPVAYSLGNYLSNQRDRYTDGGIMVRLTIQRINNKYSIAAIDYLPFWLWRLESFNVTNNLKRGYYPITKNKIAILPTADSLKAVSFFDDIKNIVTGIKEWEVQ